MGGVLPHPPYSPDLTPSDYYLFQSLKNFLDGKTFIPNEGVKNGLDYFFAGKDQWNNTTAKKMAKGIGPKVGNI